MNEIVKELQDINLDLFYCASIWKFELTLQGKISSEAVAYCKEKFGISEFSMTEGGYLEAEAGKIKIVLT